MTQNTSFLSLKAEFCMRGSNKCESVSIKIIEYGGPDRRIKLSEFKNGTVFPRRYRNRRLGDFLKELDLTEGKATPNPHQGDGKQWFSKSRVPYR